MSPAITVRPATGVGLTTCKRELYDEDKLKMIKEQLKTAKNELAIIEEKTSKGFK